MPGLRRRVAQAFEIESVASEHVRARLVLMCRDAQSRKAEAGGGGGGRGTSQSARTCSPPGSTSAWLSIHTIYHYPSHLLDAHSLCSCRYSSCDDRLPETPSRKHCPRRMSREQDILPCSYTQMIYYSPNPLSSPSTRHVCTPAVLCPHQNTPLSQQNTLPSLYPLRNTPVSL